MNGIILINKEKNYTSRDVVNIIGKCLHTKKVGHTGTLDPMAEGVLVICVGSATKLVDILTSNYKEYIAEVTLGVLTDTLDISGKVLKEESISLSDEKIIKVINDMKGTYEQEVPIYSAVKVNGRKLYEYARNSEEVKLPKRMVDIKNIELASDIKHDCNKIIFSFKCMVSKGTYIRSLVRDIALNLGTIGVMSKLVRTKQGIFDIENCNIIDDIKNNKFKLYSINECLKDYYKVIVDSNLESKIRNGIILDNIYNHDIVLFVNKKEEVIALYKEYEKDRSKLKPFKMFR